MGVRTGFCGSLTTFASWELSMIQLLIGGTVCAHDAQTKAVYQTCDTTLNKARISFSQLVAEAPERALAGHMESRSKAVDALSQALKHLTLGIQLIMDLHSRRRWPCFYWSPSLAAVLQALVAEARQPPYQHRSRSSAMGPHPRHLSRPSCPQGRDGGQWPGFFWGFIIGLQLALSSYIFGQHVALFISSIIEKDSSPDRPGTSDPAAEIPEEDVEMEDAGGLSRCVTGVSQGPACQVRCAEQHRGSSKL